jgi:hypothetical protein
LRDDDVEGGDRGRSKHDLDAGGLKAKLAEVGPVAAASVLDFFASLSRQIEF